MKIHKDPGVYILLIPGAICLGAVFFLSGQVGWIQELWNLLAGSLALLLALPWLYRQRGQSRRFREESSKSNRHRLAQEQFFQKQIQSLRSRLSNQQAEIEVLTALREVSRVVRHNVQFQSMINEVMPILFGVIGQGSLSLFLEEEDGEVRPAAFTNGNEVVFAERPTYLEIEDTGVSDCARSQIIVKTTSPTEQSICIPLSADGEFIGVLRAACLNSEVQDINMRKIEAVLRDAAPHLAMGLHAGSLHTRATICALTNLYTKRQFLKSTQDAINLHARNAGSLSLIMIDIDHFKKVNDTHGHNTGDMILSGVAHVIQDCLREGDLAFRYGGEEMSILLRGYDTKSASKLAERIRQSVEDTTFKGDKGQIIPITISLGIAGYDGTVSSPEEFVVKADKALYLAKDNGRNQVVVEGQRRAIRKRTKKRNAS